MCCVFFFQVWSAHIFSSLASPNPNLAVITQLRKASPSLHHRAKRDGFQNEGLYIDNYNSLAPGSSHQYHSARIGHQPNDRLKQYYDVIKSDNRDADMFSPRTPGLVFPGPPKRTEEEHTREKYYRTKNLFGNGTGNSIVPPRQRANEEGKGSTQHSVPPTGAQRAVADTGVLSRMPAAVISASECDMRSDGAGVLEEMSSAHKRGNLLWIDHQLGPSDAYTPRSRGANLPTPPPPEGVLVLPPLSRHLIAYPSNPCPGHSLLCVSNTGLRVTSLSNMRVVLCLQVVSS